MHPCRRLPFSWQKFSPKTHLSYPDPLSSSESLRTATLTRPHTALWGTTPLAPPPPARAKDADVATSACAHEARAPARGARSETRPLHPGLRRRQCRRAGVTWVLPFRLWPAGRGRLLARRVEPRVGSPSSLLFSSATREFSDAG
jgi:hypothetical protein